MLKHGIKFVTFARTSRVRICYSLVVQTNYVEQPSYGLLQHATINVKSEICILDCSI